MGSRPDNPNLHRQIRDIKVSATMNAPQMQAARNPDGHSRALKTAVSLMRDSTVPMWLAWGPDLIMYYNDAYAPILAHKHPAAHGAPLSQVWAEIWDDVAPLVAETLAGKGLYRADFPLMVNDPQGTPQQRWFSFSYSPVRDDDDSIQGLLCTVWDTTESVKTRHRLAQSEVSQRESERQFQALFETMDEGFCIIEFFDGPHGPLSDYVHIVANPAYTANAGIPDIVGQRVREMVPDEADAWVEIYRDVLLTGKPIRFERELVRTGRFLELAAFRIEPPERRHVAVLFKDVSERRQAEVALRELNDSLEQRVTQEVTERLRVENALRQAQKMEAVGQLTGGIAHDFNNMLAVVMGSLELLGRRFATEDPKARRYVDAAREGAKRAAQLTQRLLAFSRQQPLRPEVVDANKLVAGMSELLGHTLGGIKLETVQAAGLWRTHADPNQLENVIVNLAVNGRDAMGVTGRLTIETANCFVDERYAAENLGISPGQYVMIAVTDTGTGMSEAVMAQAFDPFFTTKKVGQGTGLGLSQVYGFVKQSGGHVKIYSEEGQGTSVKVYLPRLIGRKDEPAPQHVGHDIAMGDYREVILVVEDEPAVRRFSVDALTELGYSVLEADSGTAALQLLDRHPEINLMFTDVVMPEMNGRRLADEALKRRPELRILFTTGYTRNAIVHNGVLDVGVHLIGKPFSLDALAAGVRAALDA